MRKFSEKIFTLYIKSIILGKLIKKIYLYLHFIKVRGII